MIEQDIVELQKTFYDMVGINAQAQISEVAAENSAGLIIDLETNLNHGQTKPVDLYVATIATSQLIERCRQVQDRVAVGLTRSVDDKDVVCAIDAKLSEPTISESERKRLLKYKCIADPIYGAKKAMDVFTHLHVYYGGFITDNS